MMTVSKKGLIEYIVLKAQKISDPSSLLIALFPVV